jgi:hypothetical protein
MRIAVSNTTSQCLLDSVKKKSAHTKEGYAQHNDQEQVSCTFSPWRLGRPLTCRTFCVGRRLDMNLQTIVIDVCDDHLVRVAWFGGTLLPDSSCLPSRSVCNTQRISNRSEYSRSRKRRSCLDPVGLVWWHHHACTTYVA